MDFLKKKNAALEAQIAQAMAAPTQRAPTRDERIAHSLTSLRSWAKNWRKELTSVLEEDKEEGFEILTDEQRDTLLAHLAEVEELYAKVTRLFSRMVCSDLEHAPGEQPFLAQAIAELDKLEPEIDAEIGDRKKAREVEAAKKTEDEKPATSNVIVLPSQANGNGTAH